MIKNYYLRRIPISKDGYTRGGRYYGIGLPVYQAEHKETGETLEFRAADRFQARVKLQSILLGKEDNLQCHTIERSSSGCIVT